MDSRPNEPQEAEAPPVEMQTVECWRCGKQIDRTLARCPFCAARPRSLTRPIRPKVTPTAEGRATVRLIVMFTIFLFISVIHGVVIQAALSPDEVGRANDEGMLYAALFLEAVDTVLVIIALAWISIPRRAERPSLERRATTWLMSLPVLTVVFLINYWYHWYLREALDLELLESPLAGQTDLLPLWIAVICLQPAVIEELFFRYLGLGVLRNVMGVHGAVLVSSLMFGLAHIYVPLSIPVMILLGIVFGYARLASGSLVLPMMMHGLHNAAVMAAEWYSVHAV
ncbi:MAG TPA: type II CAAX endopeptidase family protein [Thermoguttaceae bacterium]|nr:type II CAAX endopeptidase family protein [Thermoguttaceae bacterium]